MRTPRAPGSCPSVVQPEYERRDGQPESQRSFPRAGGRFAASPSGFAMCRVSVVGRHMHSSSRVMAAATP
eukprot:CAMPEP_0180115440 /NCGR_PEP_ID=MMETSP0985-20121206/37852_1 /TAXON_ID=483367 /ORGANISM="non described non described, Strain CCMP 2436" /LENGTH=69 /DNA_ID=CAMNT_0022054081 /DNA_START=59 /DNA_END=264 /DNA_ORIENTATION=-